MRAQQCAHTKALKQCKAFLISYVPCDILYIYIYILAYSKVLSIGIKRKHKLQTATTTARTGDMMKHAYWVSNELRAASRCHRPLKCILKILLLHCGVAQVECRIEWVGVLAYCAHTHTHTQLHRGWYMSFNVHKLFSAAARNGVNYAFMPHARREYLDALAAFDLWPRARAPHSMPQNLWQLGKLLLQIGPRVAG